MNKKVFARAALFLAGVFAFSAVFAQGELFTIKPANPNVETPDWLMYEVKPGGSVTDEVTVKNLSDKSMTFQLAAVDQEVKALGEAEGTFALTSGDAEMKTIGKWVKLAKSQVTLAAKSEEKVSFTLTVPAATALQKYAGGITVQPAKGGVGTGKDTSVVIATRVGVRMYVSVTEAPRVIEKKAEPEAAAVSGKEGASEAGEEEEGVFTPLNIGLGVLVAALFIYVLSKAFKQEKM